MDIRMPNGTLIRNVPEGLNKAEVLSRLSQSGYDTEALLRPRATPQAAEPEKEYAGFFEALLESAGALGAADEAARWAGAPTEENRRALLEKADSNYKSASFGLSPTEDLSVLDRNWTALKQLAGGTLGFLVAPAVAGTTAALATGAVSGPGAIVSAPIAGGIAGYGTAGLQYTTQNLIRQAQEQQRAIDEGRAAEGPSLGAAVTGAAGQTALDVVGGRFFAPLLSRFPLFRNLAIGDDKVARESLEVIQDAVNKGTLERTAGGTFRGVGKGVIFEVPQEVAQQAIERAQAGLSLTDEEARQEFTQAAVGAAALGGIAGGVQARYAEPRQQLQERQERAVGVLRDRFLQESEGRFQRLVNAYKTDYEARTGKSLSDEEAIKAVTQQEEYARQKEQPTVRLTPEQAEKLARVYVFGRQAELTEGAQQTRLAQTAGLTGEELAAAREGAPTIQGARLASRAPEGTQGSLFTRGLPESRPPEEAARLGLEKVSGGVTAAEMAEARRGARPGLDAVREDMPSEEVKAAPSAIVPREITNERVFRSAITRLRNQGFLDKAQADSLRNEVATKRLTPKVGAQLLYEMAQANERRGSTTVPKPTGLTPVESFIEDTRIGDLFRAQEAEDAKLLEVLQREEAAATAAKARAATERDRAAVAAQTSAIDESLANLQAERTDLRRRGLLRSAVEDAAETVQRRSLEGEFDPYAELEKRFVAKLKAEKLVNAQPTEQERDTISTIARLIMGRGREAVEKKVIPSPPGSVQLEGLEGQIPPRPSKAVAPGQESQLSFPGMGRKGPAPTVQPEAEAVPAREVEPVNITANLLNTLGVPMANNMLRKQFGANLRKAIIGKNTADPAVQQRIADYLRETPRGAISDNTRYELENLIGRRDVAQRELFQPEKFSVEEDIVAVREKIKNINTVVDSAFSKLRKGEPLGLKGFRVALYKQTTSVLKELTRLLNKAKPAAKGNAAQFAAKRFAEEAKLTPLDVLIAKQVETAAPVTSDLKTLIETAVAALEEKNLAEAKLNMEAIKTGLEADNWADLLITPTEKRYFFGQQERGVGQRVQAGPPMPKSPPSKVVVPPPPPAKVLKPFQTKNAKENLKRAKDFVAKAFKEGSITADNNKFLNELLDKNAKPDTVVAAATKYAMLKRRAAQVDAEAKAKNEEAGKFVNRYTSSGKVSFRRDRVRAKGMLAGDVRRVVERLTANWRSDLNVEVVQSVNNLPTNLAVQVTAIDVGTVKGLAVRDGNTVFIIADNMDSNADIQATLYHEALGHAGLTRLFGKKLDSVLRAIYSTNSDLKREADAWLQNNPDEYAGEANRELRALEEVLAERAENGRASAPILTRIVTVIRNFARALGLELKYTNADVAALLMKAHDIVVEGGRRAPLPQELDKKLAFKIEKAAELQTKVEGARFYSDMLSGTSALLDQYRSSRKVIPALEKSGILPALKRKTLKGLLTMLQTADIERLFGNTLPIKALTARVEEMAMRRGEAVGSLLELLDEWKEFNVKHPDSVSTLDNSFIYATLAQINPTKRSIPARPSPIETKVYGAYNALPDSGKALFKKVLNSYEQHAKEEVAAYLKIVERSSLEGDINDPDTPKGAIYAELKRVSEGVAKLEVYFPLMRFGKYSFAVGEGDRMEFYLFESEVTRNAAMAQRQAELSTDPDPELQALAKTTRAYDEIKTLGAAVSKTAPDTALSKIMTALDKSKLEESDVAAIRDAATQLFIRALPDQSVLARMRSRAERKEITGFSMDTYRVFAASQATNINRANRLAYRWILQNDLSKIKEEIEKKQGVASPNEISQLNTVLNELKSRVDRELDPRTYDTEFEQFGDRLARLGNAGAFYWFLSAPKQIVINFVQGPGVTAPVLAAQYGMSIPAVLKMMGKHTRYDSEKYTLFNLDKSLDNIKDGATRQAFERMYKQRLQAGTFEETRSADLNQISRVPSVGQSTFSSVQNKVGRVLRFGFQQSEVSIRQIAYATSFELAYAKAIKDGRTADQATTDADSAAMATINNTLFNYSQWNKPTLFTAHWSLRLATQFMSYPLQMSSLLIRSFHNMYSRLNTKEEKRMAAKQFWGMMMMTGMLGGVTGLPLYPLIAGLMDALANDLAGDDDEGTDNPLYLQDSDFWFREWWIPTMFGSGSGLASTLNLSDDQANLLARSIKYGPVSAVTGLDISSSVSLADLPFMFLLPDIRGALSPEDAVRSALYDTALGPFGGLLAIGGTAYKDFAEGNWQRGIEALLPNFIKGIATGTRYAMEGATTRTGTEIAGREWFTAGRLIGQGLGFRPIELTEAQNALYDAIQADKKLERERNSILRNLDRARQAGDAAEVQRIIEEDVMSFNRKYPTLGFTYDSIASSYRNRQQNRIESVAGLNTNSRGLDYAEREIMGGYQENFRD